MRTCPYPGCTAGVSTDRLACATHWYLVPRDLRSRVWTAFLANDYRKHRAAVSAVLQFFREHARG